MAASFDALFQEMNRIAARENLVKALIAKSSKNLESLHVRVAQTEKELAVANEELPNLERFRLRRR
jgi:hypothetical protein